MKHAKLIVLGSGPAGATAAIYAGRAMLDPLLIRGNQPGGQLTLTTEVENYPGFTKIDSLQLVQQMEEQAKACGASLVDDHIEKLDLSQHPFVLQGFSGQSFSADALILATGAEAKWLGLAQEKLFQGFGVSACATCDGFFFKNQSVAVVGGGNTAFEEALYLANLCQKVTLIHRRDSFRAEPIMQQKVKQHPKIELIVDTVVTDFDGQREPKKLEKIQLQNLKTGVSSWLPVAGCFIAIGHTPNTDFLAGQIDLDPEGFIVLPDPITTKTNRAGVFAAGDVADKKYRQAVTAAATGCKAALDAFHFLQNHTKLSKV